ncbi:alpha/beta fold hydrolase [Altererythrobacter sp. Z27]|uniref:alpha/beta fold hydrolase n=1 Tax=Altererythrobacter sp. Z27 TaxID=3461147 RepID=UPI004044F820
MKWVLRIVGILFALLLVAFLLLRTPDTDPAEMRAKYAGAPSQFVELGNGLTVHLRDEGPRDAPVIILLHGSNADLSTWQPWVEALKADYRVIRFDQRGHGLTGPAPDDDYSPASFVGDIQAVADNLGLEQFVLGGNSMGGGLTVAYAIEHPDRLYGMVLVDAGGAPIQREGGGNIGFTIARTPVINKLMEHVTPRSMVEKSLRQSVSNEEVVTPQAVDRYWEMLRYPGNRAATVARFSLPRTPFTEEQVAALDMPALVMWGVEDALIPVEAGRWYDRVLPASTLVEYPGIGHLPQDEAPEQSVDDLRAWLEQLFPLAPEG